MTHYQTSRRGAFAVYTATDVGRTVNLRVPHLRPFTDSEVTALSEVLHGQADVVARLCADVLTAEGTHAFHGGLLEPAEAARLRPIEVLGAAGPEELPAWREQGRARLLETLAHAHGLVRLVGVTCGNETYWIYTDEGLSRYVGGVRVPDTGGDILRRLLYGGP